MFIYAKRRFICFGFTATMSFYALFFALFFPYVLLSVFISSSAAALPYRYSSSVFVMSIFQIS